MSFAGLKQRAADAAKAKEDEAFEQSLAAAAQEEADARALVAAAEGRVDDAVAQGKRELLVLRMEEVRHCSTPRTRPGPMGFGIDWDPLAREDLRGVALKVYDLLAEKREALPEGERFDIALKAYPLGRGCVAGWDLGIFIKW